MKKKTYLKLKKNMKREIRRCKKLNCNTISCFIMSNVEMISWTYKIGSLGFQYSEWLRCI